MGNVQVAAFLILLGGGMAAAQKSPNPPARREFPMAVVAKQCIDFAAVKHGKEPGDLRECAVSEFGEFASMNGHRYYYALYCLIPNYADKGRCGDGSFIGGFYALHRGLAIFQQDPASSDKAQLLFERVNRDLGTKTYARPQLIRRTSETLLAIPITVDGSEHLNESEYFLWSGSAWTPLESKKWLDDLERRIPSEFVIRNGIWPDLETLRAEAGLYAEDDAKCCPSGGLARIALAIRSGSIVLQSLTIEKDQ
jgi:hypothetical protein